MTINDNTEFLKNSKQGFERTISWNKHRSEITMQAKRNNLYYIIDSAFININRLFALSPSLNANYNDGFPERNSFDKYYMLVVEIKYFNVLINNKPFFKQLIKNKKHIKNISKRQEKITIQEETSCIICIIKILQPHWYRFIKREKHSQFSKN